MGIHSSVFDENNINNLDTSSFAHGIKNDPDCVLLDVRTIEEHMQARIPNSTLLDFYGEDFLANLENLEREKSYYIYCRSGHRSYLTAVEMRNMGFNKIFNLANGIISWDGEIEND